MVKGQPEKQAHEMALQEQGINAMRVLYAGSNTADMRLAGRQLVRGGFAVTADIARTPEEFAIQLGATPYDLVLAEIELPDWPGGSALRIWKPNANGVPFILVVSTAQENEAFECVKRGATDYVLNTNLERLPLAFWQQRERSIRAMEAQEAADREKRELSYELRASVSGIVGMTELVLDTDLAPEQRECLEAVELSASSLLAVACNIVESPNVQNEEPRLAEIGFDLRDHLAEATSLLASTARRKGLELLLDVRPAAPRFVQGDPAQLRQIVFHLMNNALEFTECGEILLRAGLESENKEGVLMRFMVSGAGVGIRREEQLVIPDSSSQRDASLTGLTIAARRVSGMGGQIWVENEPGRGGSFHFTAPFKRPAEGRDGL